MRVGASVAAGAGLVPQLPPVMMDRHTALCLTLGPQPGQDIAMMGGENSGVLEVAFIGAGAPKRAGFLGREIVGPAQMFTSVKKAITAPPGLITVGAP